MRSRRPPTAPQPNGGFTILELLLAVAIMTVIVLGLYTVFDQTQKALRGTLAQVDVLEGIRSTTDVLSRDIEGAVPIDFTAGGLTSFAATVNPVTSSVELEGLGGPTDPLFQTVLQSFYFVTRQNNIWTAIGYWVGPVSTNVQPGQLITIGRLYRFQYRTNALAFSQTNLFLRFQNQMPPWPDSQPVMDGIVHLRLIVYDSDGLPLLNQAPPFLSYDLNDLLREKYPLNSVSRPWFRDRNRNTETGYHFYLTNSPPFRPSFPSSLELEIGIVEPQVVQRFSSIPVPGEAKKYLARSTGQVHLFRQRIHLRNAPL